MDPHGDGTAPSHTSEAPKEEPQRHHAYCAHLPLAIMVVDAAGRHVEVNPTACRVTGYAEGELLAMSLADLLAEESLETGRRHFARVKEAGRASGELCWVRKDGSKRWSTRETFKLSEDRFVSFFLDETDRKQAEETLGSSDHKQQAILDSIRDPVWLKDKAGRFLAVNTAWCRFAQTDSEQALGKTSFEVFPSDAAQRMWHQDRHVLQSGQALFIEELLHEHDGQPVWFETLKTPVFDERGAVTGLAGVAREITARKRAEEALQKSEATFRSMFLDSAIGMEVYDAAGKLLQVNPACLAIFGVEDASELSGFNLFEDPNVSEAVKDRLRQGRTVRYEVPFSFDLVKQRKLYRTSKSGTIYLSIVISPTKIAPGSSVQNYLVQVEDITEHKQSEAILAAERDLACRLTSTRNTEEAVRVCVDTAIALSGFECGGVYLVNPESRSLELVHHVGSSTEFWESAASVCPGLVQEHLLMEGLPVEIPRRQMEEIGLATAIQEGFLLLAAVPVMHEQRPVACLTIASRRASSLTPHARQALETVAAQIGAAICRVQAEERLRESEERLRLALQAAGGGVWDWDLTNCEAWWSPEMYELWGVDPGTPMHCDNTMPFIHPQDRDVVARTTEDSILRRLDYECEFRICHATRGERWMASRGRTVCSAAGLPTRMIGVSVDITERKQEQARRDVLYRSIEIASDAAFWTDLQGRFTYVNSAACESVGYSRDELLQMQISDVNPRASAERWKEVWAQLRDQGPQRFESIHRRKDGSEFPVEVVSTYVKHGALEYVCGFAHDITRRRRAEQERLEMERRLLHAQKLESLGVMAGGIAHDFNNILAGILGYADLVKASLPPSEPAIKDVEVIRDAARKAAELTRQMLAYSGKGKFIVEMVNLSRLVEDTRKMLEMSVAKKATLTYDLALHLPPIDADASQIHQVLLNLVINASEALGEAGGVIGISTTEKSLSKVDCAAVSVGNELAEGTYVSLEVADNGCGMDGETLTRIFDPFYTTKFTGRGLGLAAVHGIVRGHKGGIQVLSALGSGTTFRVFFPTSKHPDPPSRVESGAAPWQGSGTVLVVDDDDIARNTAERMLQHLGLSVLRARDGDEAIRLFRQHEREIACVLLDLTMPKLNGEETFRELRRIRPEVPVILLSGYSEEDATGRFSGLGLAGFIQKPYELSAMVATLRKVVACCAGGLSDRISADGISDSRLDSAARAMDPGAKDQLAAKKPTCEGKTVLIADDDEMARRSTQVLFELAGFSVLGASDGEEAIRQYREHREQIVCVFLDLAMPKKDGEETLRELRRMGAKVSAIVSSGFSAKCVSERFVGLDVLEFVQKPEPLDAVIDKLQRACQT